MWQYCHRGFESHPFRHFNQELQQARPSGELSLRMLTAFEDFPQSPEMFVIPAELFDLIEELPAR